MTVHGTVTIPVDTGNSSSTGADATCLTSGSTSATLGGSGCSSPACGQCKLHPVSCRAVLEAGSSEVSKRTFQPNNRRRAKTHGFRLRMRTRAGRLIVKARRLKGRLRLTA